MSKIAREIAHALFDNVLQCDIETIDSVLAGKIIKRSTLDELTADRDYWLDRTHFYENRCEELKGELKDTRQNLHHTRTEWNIESDKLKRNIWLLEEQLNQYRQAEEVESKLDTVAAARDAEFLAAFPAALTEPSNQNLVSKHIAEAERVQEYNRGFNDGYKLAKTERQVYLRPKGQEIKSTTWSWRGEPYVWSAGMAGMAPEVGKDSNTPPPAEVKQEPSSESEQPADARSKWRDFLSCIGFKA